MTEQAKDSKIQNRPSASRTHAPRVPYKPVNALSGPAVIINQSHVFPAHAIKDDGQLINSNVTVGCFEIIDSGERSFYELPLIKNVIAMASLPDFPSKAIAAFQTISIIGQRANGIPGDSCQEASLINAFIDDADCLQVIADYMKKMCYYIDVMVGLVNNPNDIRYSSGLRGNCAGGGRSYQFDEAWDRIIDQCNANEEQLELLYGQYCASKRLYDAFDVRCNNVAAATTAATMPEVQQIVRRIYRQLGNFLRAVASNVRVNVAAAAEALKVALRRVVASIRY